MEKLKIEYIDINSIKPYKNNAKLHPKEQIEQIKKSIRQFGMDDPIGIWKDEIVEGHGRLLACKELGFTEVPVIKLDHLSDEERKAYTLAHNKLTMNSDFDLDILNSELDNILNIDMSDFGFDLDLEDEEEKEIIEDEVPEVPEEPKTKLGDIYQLGNHRLMCGDSTNPDDVTKLMNGVKADMVFTDPPYRMEAQGGSNQWVGRQAAKLGESIKDLCDFNPTEFLNRLNELFENNMNAYIFCNKDLVPDYLNWGIENNYSFNILFWKKPNALPLGGQHRPDTEYLLFFRKNAIWNNGLENVSYSKCLEFSRDNSTDHPTMKPLGLIGNELKISSNENSIIVDLFGGSGSTLIACEQLNRKCYMMELDPHYIDVIIQRWENFTGEKAVLLNRKEEE